MAIWIFFGQFLFNNSWLRVRSYIKWIVFARCQHHCRRRFKISDRFQSHLGCIF